MHMAKGAFETRKLILNLFGKLALKQVLPSVQYYQQQLRNLVPLAEGEPYLTQPVAGKPSQLAEFTR